jgi:serine protease Do
MDRSRVTPLWFGGIIGLAFGLAILLVWVLSGRITPGESPAPSGDGGASSFHEPATQSSQPVQVNDVNAGRENAIVRAIRMVSPSVVSINTVRHTSREASRADLLLGTRQRTQTVVGLGSGILVDHRGYVLTSNHIVAGSEQLRITLSDGQSFDAELVGASLSYDLAVIKIRGTVSGLPVAPLGDSGRVRPGEWAIAIGSPFSYLVEDNEPTVTVGVISAVNRSVRSRDDGPLYRDMMQTDAAINPGNSGGPLVDVRGEVVGINTTAITDAGGARTGLGFAIPINRGRWVMEEILLYGRVRPSFIGLRGVFLDAAVRESRQLGDELPVGWLVVAVGRDSPASRAGLNSGDVITRIDGQDLVDDRARESSMFEARVGLTLRVTVWRDGRTFEAELAVEEARP